MEKLLEFVEITRGSEVKALVDSRIKEFRELGKKSDKDIFKELCFCILTANFNAERAIKIQDEIGNGFLGLSEGELENKLRTLGYRYPPTRARDIVGARKFRDSLKNKLNSFESDDVAREWLVKNVKGLGYKEASHFLRNIGYGNVAIVDFHIIDLLEKYTLIERPKTLTKKKYLEVEKVLKKIAGELNLNLAELDLYLWYVETGKVLK
jgi:N-glycosylase/DNA lyase